MENHAPDRCGGRRVSTSVRLGLDFVRTTGAPAALRYGLLLAGLAAAGGSLEWTSAIERESDALHDQVAKLRRESRAAGISAAQTAPAPRPNQLASAQNVIRRIALPWPALLREVDAAAGEGVALLSIEPDAASRSVRISGNAKDLLSLRAFVRRLESAGQLARVHILEHRRATAGEAQLGFVVAGSWSGA